MKTRTRHGGASAINKKSFRLKKSNFIINDANVTLNSYDGNKIEVNFAVVCFGWLVRRNSNKMKWFFHVVSARIVAAQFLQDNTTRGKES